MRGFLFAGSVALTLAVMPCFASHCPGCTSSAPPRAGEDARPLPIRRPVTKAATRGTNPIRSWVRAPLDFEANRGQAPRAYAFIAHGPDYVLGVSRAGLALSLAGRDNSLGASVNENPTTRHPASELALTLVNPNQRATVAGVDALSGRSNYFLGNDPARWRTHVPHYRQVRIASAWQGIDLVLYGDRQKLEYDFDVAPGANPQSIRLQVDGAQSVRLTQAGDAILHTSAGNVELKHPLAYQVFDGRRHAVESRFRMATGGRLEFALGRYDHRRALIIDPVLDFSVALGGSNGNQIVGVAVDSNGDIYVTGNTCSADFPATSGDFQSIHSNPLAKACEDAFVTKMDPAGATLLFSDFIGASGGASSGAHLAVDSTGVYVVGGTNTTDFPTVANIGPTGDAPCGISTKSNNCPNGFVLKLSPDGSQLLFSSLLGGTQASGAYQVRVNPVTGDVDVVGETNSADFEPKPNTLQTSFPGGSCTGGNPCFSGFLLGLDPASGALRYGTFLGGAGNHWASGLAFDKSGNIYVSGSTQPPPGTALGPVTHTYAPAGGATSAGSAAFVAKLNLAGNQLTPGYLTLVQGDADTGASSIAVDGSGNAYFAGGTAALHLPVTTGVYQTTNKSTYGPDCDWAEGATVMHSMLPAVCGTGFVGELNAAGSLSFLTYLGGSGEDYVEALDIDSTGNIWLTGVTSSQDFPLSPDHYLMGGGPTSPFLAEMSADGTSLPFASLIAGPFGQSTDLQVDSKNNVYVAGFGSTATSTPAAYPQNLFVFLPSFVQKWSAGGAPSISLSAMKLNFPDTSIGAESAQQTITIHNPGTSAAELAVSLSTAYTGIEATDFLESSDCGTSLAGGSSCTITAAFAPGPPQAGCLATPGCSPAQRSGEISINTNAIQGQQTVMLAGNAVTGPAMEVVPSPIAFPAQAAGTSSQPAFVTVESTGDSDLNIASIVLGGPNASEFQLTTTGVGGPECTNPVPPAVGCNLTVTFSPAASASGTRTATLTFRDTAGDSPQIVNISGVVAQAAALNISPLNFDIDTFPVAIGNSTTGSLTLQNPSVTNDIQVVSLVLSGANAADFSTGNGSCGAVPFTVAKGSSCSLQMNFAPAAGASGLRKATLTVGTNPAITSLPQVTVDGDAVTNSQPGMQVQLVPNPMNFGALQVGEPASTATVFLTVYNNNPIPCAGGASTCGGPLIISAIQFGLSDYTIAGVGQTPCTTFPATITPGNNCSYAIAFTPSKGGSRNTTVTIQSNDPQGTVQLPIYGTGLTLPLGTFLQTALNFGNSAIGVASPPLSTTLQNLGQANLTIANIAASTNFAVLGNTCNGSLAPQATCTISVSFTPPSAGPFNGTLTITDNDPFGSTQTVNLTGSGATGPQLRFAPPVVTFPNQSVNTLGPAQTITLTSTGDTALTFPANAIRSPADFILQGTTCGSTLAPGTSCTASVQFRPTTTDFPEYGDLLVTDNAVGSPQPLYLSGEGVAGTTTASTTVVTSSANPAPAGQSVAFTATVTGPAGSTTVPTGSVTFLDGTSALNTANLDAQGEATTTTSSLSVGPHAITAVYGGDANYSGSTSTVLSEVITTGSSTAATTTTLNSAPNPSAVGQSVTFTATVAGPSGNTTVPTGTVTFLDGTAALGTGNLNSSGQAVYSTSSLAAGSHSITAQYAGDTDFSGSTSSVLTQSVGTPGFSLSVNPTTVTVMAGSAGTATVSVTPTLGFNQQVSFTCSGLPAASTCAFSPATVTPSGNTDVTTTLTIATNVTSAIIGAPRFFDPQRQGPTLLAFLLIGLGGLVRVRRRWISCLFALVLIASVGVISGCGGSSGKSSAGNGSGGGSTTPSGTNTITVTATAGSLSEKTTFTLTIQ